MLDKRLQLGGLQVGGPRTMQNTARFRVANNVYQTRDDYMVPRSDGDQYQATYTSSTSLKTITRYKSKPFVLGYDGAKYIPYYESSTAIPSPDLPAEYGSYGPQGIEKLGNLYYNLPSHGIYKYDGYQTYRAGSPLPFYEVGATYLVTPTFYVRQIQHHIDQQGNVVNSGYIEHQARLVAGKITIRTDKGATPDPNIVRQPIELASLNNDFLAYFASATTYVENQPAGTVTITTGGDHNVKVGIYLIAKIDEISYSGVLSYGLAYKVVGSTATTVSLANPRYLDISREWKDGTGIVSYPGNPCVLSHYWISTWTASSSTSAYFLQDLNPAVYESNSNHTFDVFISSVTTATALANKNTFNLSEIMGDTYDVLSTKQIFPVTTELLPKSFSTYGDLGLLSYDNEIFYSDVTLGGAFEMTTGDSFIVAGEGDDGLVQSICGTSDFLLVSRQYKNYYLTGNIPTANYRVSEISQTNLGCYSNESSLSVNDKVIFLNKQGIWALYTGGKCEELSFNIKGLFDNFSDTFSWPEEAYFDLDDYSTYAESDVSNKWVRVRLDVNRSLMAFVIYGEGEGVALILNLNNGEFYTWDKLIHDVSSPDIQDIAFINGFYFKTQNGAAVVSSFKEDKGDYSYATTSPPTLQTTWFTAGEPSLEKKLNQLKMWGLIDSVATITHNLDWLDSPTYSDTTYVKSLTGQMSHKKRLTGENFQAVSVGMSFAGSFQLEGLEIEFHPFQGGMKK